MTEAQYNKFCDDNYIPEIYRKEEREHIEKMSSFKGYELVLAVDELKANIIDALPKWVRRLFK